MDFSSRTIAEAGAVVAVELVGQHAEAGQPVLDPRERADQLGQGVLGVEVEVGDPGVEGRGLELEGGIELVAERAVDPGEDSQQLAQLGQVVVELRRARGRSVDGHHRRQVGRHRGQQLVHLGLGRRSPVDRPPQHIGRPVRPPPPQLRGAPHGGERSPNYGATHPGVVTDREAD